MKNKANITTLDQILDKKYGKKGAVEREQCGQELQLEVLGEMIRIVRIDKNLHK